jgi:hypothetical protein
MSGPSQAPKAANIFTSPIPPPPSSHGKSSSENPTANPAKAHSGPIPCGLSVYTQWFLKSTTNVWTSSDGLEFTFSLP